MKTQQEIELALADLEFKSSELAVEYRLQASKLGFAAPEVRDIADELMELRAQERILRWVLDTSSQPVDMFLAEMAVAA